MANPSIDWKRLALRAKNEEDLGNLMSLVRPHVNPLWRELAGLTPEQIEARYKRDPTFRKMIDTFVKEANFPSFPNLKLLQTLWYVAEQEQTLDPIGLILHYPLERNWYHNTPLNVSTFADTGGDGVHYSLLDLEGSLSDRSPVVMTVPMNWPDYNLVVGKDLHDFLCLGCQIGYFSLEQLTYGDSKSELIYDIEHPDEFFAQDIDAKDTPIMKHQLAALTSSFSLRPWTNIGEKLEGLQRQFGTLIKKPADK